MAKHTLDGFRSYLEEFDLQGTTITSYLSDVRQAQENGGPVARLRDQEGAPKSRRRYLAAFRRWADYTNDPELVKALKRVRLPPPKRKTPKVPLERDEFERFVDEIGRVKVADPLRGVLGLMACRGLRCGDALRLRREEVDNALAPSSGVLSFVAKGRRRLEFRTLKTYRRFLELIYRSFEASPKAKTVAQLVSPRASAKGAPEAAARAVERALVKIGVGLGIYGLHPHKLRRTYAVEYLRAMPGDPEALVKLKSHMQWAEMDTALEYVDYVRGEDLDDPAHRMFERKTDN